MCRGNEQSIYLKNYKEAILDFNSALNLDPYYSAEAYTPGASQKVI